MKYVIALALCLFAAGPAFAQHNCTDVQIECLLADLGGGTYEYTFNVINANTEDNAVFYWTVSNPNVPSSWETVSWVLPEGWTGSHPGQQLHFFGTDNSDANPYRIYSPTASGCGDGAYSFVWRFYNNGGPDPACDFGDFDYTFHMQTVDPNTCANIGPSHVCPGTVGTEDETWSTIKAGY